MKIKNKVSKKKDAFLIGIFVVLIIYVLSIIFVLYGKCCYGNGHNGLIKEFYDSIKKGEKFWIDGKEASKVIKLILSVYKQNNLKVEENQCK